MSFLTSMVTSAPCYLVLCDGHFAALIVKDCDMGKFQFSAGFIAQTNHDPDDKRDSKNRENETSRQERHEVIASSFGVDGWIEESVDRLQCIQKRWDRVVQKSRAKSSTTAIGNVETSAFGDSQGIKPSITEKTLRRWLSTYPTLNECSHFTAILDPVSGKIRWLKRGPIEDAKK
jgi:hypothetical protein